MDRSCASCGNPNARSVCSGCKAASYCSPVCQRQHWRAGHKGECKALASVFASQTAPSHPLSTSRECGACSKVGALFACGGCQQVVYCDRVCCKAAWKAHKTECSDLAKAAFLRSLALAEKGFPASQYNCGLAYGRGIGVAQDWVQSVRWYEKAAAAGHADAQAQLGVCYAEGTGVAQDWVQAARWYEKAAVAGNVDAQALLGGCYAEGTGVAQDWVQAVRWYEKAAAAGNADAHFLLGACYADGTGVTQDWVQAVRWYEKAAAAGIVGAQTKLGMCYAAGMGVAVDRARAIRWWEEAAAAGCAIAKEELARLNAGARRPTSRK
jgi:TPR repeat protein